MRTKLIRIDPELLERLIDHLRDQGYNFGMSDCVEFVLLQWLKEKEETPCKE